MDISSSQQNIKTENNIYQKQGVHNENPQLITPQDRIQKIPQFELTQIYTPEPLKLEIEVDMKLYIGQDVYRKKSKIHNYEDLQQVAQKLIKSHHTQIEGKVQIKYVDSDKDQVNIYDQDSLQTAIEDLPKTNSNQNILKVYAELVSVSDSKIPNLTLSFTSQHRVSVCSNSTNNNNSCSHNNIQQQESFTTFEQIGNQNNQKNSIQNINQNPMNISSFFQNESGIYQMEDEDDARSNKEENTSQKGNQQFNQGYTIQNQTNNILQIQQKPNENDVNSMNTKQFYEPSQDQKIGDHIYSQGIQINGQFENNQQPTHQQQLYLQQQNRKGSNQYINQQIPTIQYQQQFPQINNQLPQMNNQFPSMNNQIPPMYNQMPQMNNQIPQVNNQIPQMNIPYPQINNYIPFINNQTQQMNQQIPQLNSYNPYLNQQIPQMNYQNPYVMNQFVQSNQQMPNIPPHMMNQLDPNYYQYLQLQDYFQNMMNNNYYNSLPQKKLDQQNLSVPQQLNPHLLNGNYVRQSSLNNFQNSQQIQQQFNHKYSNSANYQTNSTIDIESTDCLSAKSNEKNEQFDQNIQYNQSRFRQNNLLDEGFNKQNVYPQVHNDFTENQQQHQKIQLDEQINQEININNSQNKTNNSNEFNNNNCSQNNVVQNNEYINNDDIVGSIKSQQYESDSKNQKQNNTLHKENFNNLSQDSEQTVKYISDLSGQYFGIQNENQLNIPQPVNQSEPYKNQIQGDLSLTTSKEDKKIPVQSTKYNSAQSVNQEINTENQQQIKNLKTSSPQRLSKQQSRNSQFNDKGMSKSAEQEIHKMENMLVHSQQVNQIGFDQYIEQSIVILNTSDSLDGNRYPKYFSTLKQIQKKTVDEIKKDPSTIECVSELLTNEKCKFCTKNLICKYKDKTKLILTIVNHKIKQVLPYLRPLIEEQIESKRRNQIRAFNSSKNLQIPSYQIKNDHINEQNMLIQDNPQPKQQSLSSNQQLTPEKYSQLTPLLTPQLTPLLTPLENVPLVKDIAIKQESNQNQLTPLDNVPQVKDINIQQENNQNQLTPLNPLNQLTPLTPLENVHLIKDFIKKQEDNQNHDDKKYLNDYTFQNLNEHDNSRRSSLGQNKSPRHCSSFENRPDLIDESESKFLNQQPRSLSEFPDESLSVSHQFGLPSEKLNYRYEMQNKQQHFNQQPLYSNFSKLDQNQFENSISNSDQMLNKDSKQNNFELYNDSKVGNQIQAYQLQNQSNNNNYFGQKNMYNYDQDQQQQANQKQNNQKLQNANQQYQQNNQHGFQIYENENISNEDEEESKEQKPEKKQIKPGSFSNLIVGSNELMKHEQSQQYSVDIPEFSQNQVIDCYPGEKKDILIDVKNTGKKHWDINNFYLKCIKGHFENKKFPPSQKIQVGDVGQIHIQVIIPQDIKTYTTQWRLFETKTANWQNETAFGSVVKIQFIVKQSQFANNQFWTDLKNQLYQLVDPNDKSIDLKLHDFIKKQKLIYNHQEIKKDKAEQLFASIINSYFDS